MISILTFYLSPQLPPSGSFCPTLIYLNMVWAGPDWLGWLGMIWRDTIVTPLFFFFERMDVWCVGGGRMEKKRSREKNYIPELD